MVRYNGLSLIAIPSLDIVVTFLDIIIRVRSKDNKLCLFLLKWCDRMLALLLGGKRRHFMFGF